MMKVSRVTPTAGISQKPVASAPATLATVEIA